MKNFLRLAFDYQKFEREPALQRIIDDVERRYDQESFSLSEDDLFLVSAAGSPDISVLRGSLSPDEEGKSP